MFTGSSPRIKSRFAFITAALVIALAAVMIPMPQSIGFLHGEALAAPPEQVPPGQLKRRGFVGVVKSISTSTSTPGTIDDSTNNNHTLLVETRFGDVEVIVTDDTRIRTPLQEDFDRSDIVGSKIAVLIKKGSAQVPDDDSNDGPIRTVTAKKIIVVPDKATRTHARAIVKEKLKDRLEVVDDNGDTLEVEGDGVQVEEGDNVILVAHRPDKSKAKTAKLVVRNLRSSIHISDRLIRLTDKLMEESDAPKLERLQDRIINYKEKQENRLDKVKERIANIREKNPDFKPLPKVTDGVSDNGEGNHEALNNLLDRLKNAVANHDSDDSGQPNRDQVKQKAAEVIKDRVKDRVQKKVEDRVKAIRGKVKQEIREVDRPQDGANGRPPVGKVIERIKDAVTSDDDNTVEASDRPDQDANAKPPIRRVVEKKVKQEVKERIQDRKECLDADGDGAVENDELECERPDDTDGDVRLRPILKKVIENRRGGRGN